ncbi:hypothetical protein HYU11_04400 [Candidatus Woesearchaeota archaeon]|nr:hypothetical protein [Candidatus Woesearchaeota archaeon]
MPGSICVIVGKMPYSRDIAQFDISCRDRQELTREEVEMVRSEGYIYFEGDGFRPALKLNIPLDIPVSPENPIILLKNQYTSLIDGKTNATGAVFLPETLTK